MAQTHLVQEFLRQKAGLKEHAVPGEVGRHHSSTPYLISQVPYSDGPVIAGGDEDVFERVTCQTPDPSLSVSVDHGVGGSVLFSNLYDLPILGSHQDFTLSESWRLLFLSLE